MNKSWLKIPTAVNKVLAQRSDGDLVERVHPYRQMMQYIMPTRNGSVVYFDNYVNAEKLVQYVPQAKARFGADITHCLVGAIAVASKHNAAMNQFSMGRRLYQRKDWHITFSMKRKRMNKKAKLSAVKVKLAQDETFEQLVNRIDGMVNVERSGKKTYHDKEYDLLTALPRSVLRLGVRGIRLLDYYNILPASFIETDPMYCSVFVANLGSLNMGAGFHHLYEWGNCPLFMMVGKIEERPVVKKGKVVPQKTLHVRWSYDERIDDGLTSRFGIEDVQRVLEDPFKYLGCVAEDGSDARPFSQISLRDDGELAKLDEIAAEDGALAEGEHAAPPAPRKGNGKTGRAAARAS